MSREISAGARQTGDHFSAIDVLERGRALLGPEDGKLRLMAGHYQYLYTAPSTNRPQATCPSEVSLCHPDDPEDNVAGRNESGSSRSNRQLPALGNSEPVEKDYRISSAQAEMPTIFDSKISNGESVARPVRFWTEDRETGQVEL